LISAKFLKPPIYGLLNPMYTNGPPFILSLKPPVTPVKKLPCLLATVPWLTNPLLSGFFHVLYQVPESKYVYSSSTSEPQ